LTYKVTSLAYEETSRAYVGTFPPTYKGTFPTNSWEMYPACKGVCRVTCAEPSLPTYVETSQAYKGT
ncbi:MAG: hypothetical protein ACOY58_04180, partial [Candidatus Micrarchaeota archaeon]